MPLTHSGRGILLDIEGTTSSVHFVYEVMFPFVRIHLAEYLQAHWGEPALDEALEQMARDAGQPSFAAWRKAGSNEQAFVVAAVNDFMDRDVKATGLKTLQGFIWESGFRGGELKAHVYDDVPPALRTWNAAGRDVRIYSSGSIHAQKLFFGHTVSGNLLDCFRGHYDTTIGPKREAESYRRITAAFEMPAADILFLSDIPAELNAAREAGLATGLVVRPGNAPVDDDCGHSTIASFEEIAWTSSPAA